MSFIIKHRGAPAIRSTFADYYCEDHGRFELHVDRDDQGDVPDHIACPKQAMPCGICPACRREDKCLENYGMCGQRAVWCISAPLAKVNPIEAVKGKWQKPEHPTWTDTRNLGEGQPLYEWREDRAKVWENKRKEDVMRFARDVNERPIGGD